MLMMSSYIQSRYKLIIWKFATHIQKYKIKQVIHKILLINSFYSLVSDKE